MAHKSSKISSFRSPFSKSKKQSGLVGNKGQSFTKLFGKAVSIESVGNYYSQSLSGERVKESAKVKGNSGFGDYSAAGEFEVWGEEKPPADGVEHHQIVRPPSRQQRCEGASSLRPLLHVAHCELHSPREAELLRLDHLESLDHKSIDYNAYSMMDNFHSPVPPPLPRRHVR